MPGAPGRVKGQPWCREGSPARGTGRGALQGPEEMALGVRLCPEPEQAEQSSRVPRLRRGRDQAGRGRTREGLLSSEPRSPGTEGREATSLLGP